MRDALSPKTIAVVVGLVVVLVVVAAFLYFKPSIGQGPPLTPKPWKPPGQWQNAPGTSQQPPATAPTNP